MDVESVTKNDHEHDQLLDSKEENEVAVVIENVRMYFSIEELKCLSYFDTLFSKRWSKSKDITYDKENKVVQLSNVGFGLNDIKCLIKCVQSKQIALDLKPKLCYLESLLNANDYLMNGSDSIINTSMLIDYFKHIKPRMSFNDKLKWLNKTNNQTLKQALQSYVNELKNKMNEARLDIVNNESKLIHSSAVTFDTQTCNELLIKRLKINWVYVNTRVTRRSSFPKRRIINGNNSMAGATTCGSMTIFIENYRNKDDFINLIENCQFDSKLKLVKPVINLVKEINKKENINKKLIARSNGDGYEIVVLCRFLLRAAEAANDGYFELSSLGLKKSDLAIAAWRIQYDNNRCFVECDKLKAFQFKLQHDICSFTKFLIDKHKLNMKTIQMMGYGKKEQARKNYFKLLKQCLIKCNEQFIVENAETWFPIIHENAYDANSHRWIFKHIVDTMENDAAFDFGIYLTKYIVFHRNPHSEFPQPYLNFLEKDLGIHWKLDIIE